MNKFLTTFAFIALLALPSSALGASTQVMRSTLGSLNSPALAGNSVVVASYQPKSLVEVLRAAPGAAPQRLFTIKPRVPGLSGLALLAASGDRVLMRAAFEGGDTDLISGPTSGPLSVVESCPQTTPVYNPAVPAIDGDLSVWSGEQCVRDRLRIQLGAVSHTVAAGGFITSLAASGRYAAWVSEQPTGNPSLPTPTQLTVYDAQAGSVAYSVQVQAPAVAGVDSDGTAVIAPSDVAGGHGLCGHDYPTRIAYYTLAAPTPHPVPVTSCNSAVRIAGGRIAFVQRLSGGSDRLALTNLAGTAVQPVAAVDALSNFAYDGAHVAWTQRRCLDYALLRRDSTDSSAPDPAITCPVHVGAPRFSRDGTLHVAVSCPNGCRPEPGGGRLQGMQVISPHWLHVVGKSRGVTRYTPFVPFSLRAGGRTVIRLPLTASQRAGLRRHPHTSVRLKVLLQHIYLPRIARTTR